MGREELDELLGAYALDAVDDAERAELDAYVRDDARARAEVQDYREIAAMMAFGGGAAPEGVWDRIVAALEEPPPPLRLLRSDDATDGGAVYERRQPRQRRRPRRSIIVAAAVALVAMVCVKVVDDRRALDDARAAARSLDGAARAAQQDPASRTVQLAAGDRVVGATAVVQGATGYLFGEALPRLDSGSTWQLWGIFDGDVVTSLGVLGPDPSVVAFSADGPLRGLALTRETRGGVPAPSGAPAFQGVLA